MQENETIFHLDIISDVICPWCFIGKRKLDAAIAALPDLRIAPVWRPFQLDPTTPPEGVDYKTRMRKRFGEEEGRRITENIEAAAEGTGIAFAFDKISRVPNTLNAHRVMRWAGESQHGLAEELFSRHFERGEDVGDTDVLLDAAEAVGLDRAGIAARLGGETDIEAVRNDDAAARDMGVSGVPAFVAARQFLLIGAQDTERLVRFFRKVQEKGV